MADLGHSFAVAVLLVLVCSGGLPTPWFDSDPLGFYANASFVWKVSLRCGLCLIAPARCPETSHASCWLLEHARTVCLCKEYRPHCDGGCGMDPVPSGMRVASSLWLGWRDHRVP